MEENWFLYSHYPASSLPLESGTVSQVWILSGQSGIYHHSVQWLEFRFKLVFATQERLTESGKVRKYVVRWHDFQMTGLVPDSLVEFSTYYCCSFWKKSFSNGTQVLKFLWMLQCCYCWYHCAWIYDDDCFYSHSGRNDVVIAFGTLSSFPSVT